MQRILPLALLLGAVACQDVAQVPTEVTDPIPAEQQAAAVSGTTTRISPNVGRGGDQPAIDGDRVVWVADNFRVRLYDLSTGTERQISSTAAGVADIDGNWIVWGAPGVGATDIWVYDLSTGTERQISLPGDQGSPAISGNRIVYEGRRLGTYDIFMYDLSTGTETVITSAPGNQRFPRISGDRIVWADGRFLPAGGIYMYDLSTGTETQISSRGAFPDISGERIVWVWNADIYLHDISTGTERVISNAPREQHFPRISGDWIVWEDYRSGLSTAPDIFLYDLSTDTETQITSHAPPTREVRPAVSRNRIVWHQYGPSEGVYLFQGEGPPVNQPPTATITSPTSGATFTEGDDITFAGSGSDPEDGDLTGSALVWTIRGVGQIGTGQSFTRSDLPVGEHTVVLTATDSEGATGTASVTFRIEAPAENQPPQAEIDSPEDGATFTTGDAITFTGSGTDPEDGPLTGASLVWRSNRDGQIGTGTSFTRSDLSAGTHVITLTATDSEGLTGTASVTITITAPPDNQPPTASISSPASGAEFTAGDEITFTGSATDPEDGPLSGSSLVWTSNRDGQIGTGTSFSRSDLPVGTHVITLRATDSEGLTGTASVRITITAPLPSCTPVEVLVGNRRPVGTVDLGIPWLAVGVLNIESYLPRPNARAEDVRIGASWETGTPATRFAIGDYNRDGHRDILLRYDIARLMSEGNLSSTTSSITVWGWDRQTGTMYCGTTSVEVVP